MSPKLGQQLKIIKLTRLELFYEDKLWIYTYDLQENNITITQIQISSRRRVVNIFSSEDKKYLYLDEEN